MARRVVITGMGIWSCLGTDLETVRQALYEGKSGIGLDEERLAYGYRSGLTGMVPKPVLTKKDLDRHIRAGMSEEAEYAFMAARQALKGAKVDADYLTENEVGCIFGNDSSAKPVVESARIMDEKHDTAMLGYGLVFQSMNSTVNMNLSTIFRLRGVNFTISAACASGSHAVGIGYMLIKQGLQDMVLCGGAQETNYYSMASFDALRTFSIRMDEPAKASRPFDKDRDGLVPSGGAAALVLEDYDHAVARGAEILCEVAGYGFSSNGGGISQPDNGEQALEIADQLIHSSAVDIIVIDSVAALTPKAEIEGDMGDNKVGLQARLMSQALRKLTSAISKTRTTCIFINQLREKIGVMFGNPETTTGGNALKFYASVRIDIRPGQAIKNGEEVMGRQTKVKIVKNKVAPPFRKAEFDIMFGEGISRAGEIIDLGSDLGIIKKSGSWFSYNDTKLAQGRDAAKQVILDNPELAEELEAQIFEELKKEKQ